MAGNFQPVMAGKLTLDGEVPVYSSDETAPVPDLRARARSPRPGPARGNGDRARKCAADRCTAMSPQLPHGRRIFPRRFHTCGFSTATRSGLPVGRQRCNARPVGFDHLILCRDLAAAGQDPRRLAREAAAGKLVRVRHGAYTDRAYWNALDDWQRYGLRVTALNRTAAAPCTFGQETSGLLWGLALVHCPRKLHVLTPPSNGGRSRHDVRRHFGDPQQETKVIGEFKVTVKGRTAIDLAIRLPFAYSVAVIDSCLRPPPRDAAGSESICWKRKRAIGPAVDILELRRIAGELTSVSKRNRAAAVIDFGTGHSDSAGESISGEYAHSGLPGPGAPTRACDPGRSEGTY